MKSTHPPQGQCWQALRDHAERLQTQTIAGLFSESGQRAQSWQVDAPGLCLDYSRNCLDDAAISALAALFQSCELPHKLQQQMDGAPINSTEQRPALHTAIRAAICGGPGPFQAEIRAEHQHAMTFANSLFKGERLGSAGKAITDVINLGIGGSDLGPRMAAAALSHYAGERVRVHFVSSLDSSELSQLLCELRADTSLFLVSSKSFSTEETLDNARRAMEWFEQQSPNGNIADHFAAATGMPARAEALGIASDNIFPIPDWIGGRYSLWSSCGLALAIAIGEQRFTEFLQGGWDMDQHAVGKPFRDNMPALLAGIEIWHRNLLNYSSLAVIPYSAQLRMLPSYLQQLVMESNGKSTTLAGEAVQRSSAPVLWGTAGTDGQHSYHQLLHQGTSVVPVDFILPVRIPGASADSERRLASHCLAQSMALMTGKTTQAATLELQQAGLNATQAARLAPHQSMPGNRPSNTLLMDSVSPRCLGALVALYEHKTFFTSVIWDINPFDQWGVELGKQLSQAILPALEGGDAGQFDPSTHALIARYRAARGE